MDTGQKLRLFLVLLALVIASVWYWQRTVPVPKAQKLARRRVPVNRSRTVWPCTKTDTQFEGVKVRTYVPTRSHGRLSPGIAYFHGGGWVAGTIESKDAVVDRLCVATGAVIVSVDYRLAPKFPFPAALEDCVKATQYFFRHVDQFKVDPKRLAVAGDSAGGNLAAAVALKLRDEVFRPGLQLQMLFYPVLQGLDFQLPSMLEHTTPPGLTSGDMCRFTALYLEGSADNQGVYCNNSHVNATIREQYSRTFLNFTRLPKKYLQSYFKPPVKPANEDVWNRLKGKLLNPYFSPLVADTLKGLPSTYILTIEHDPLRDEGLLYARRLRRSGVDVRHVHSTQGLHGNLIYRLRSVVRYISEHL